MSSIERAKAFMQRKARLLAVTAVPLAALCVSIPAQAGAITPLTLNPAACAVSSPDGFTSGGSCSTAALATGGNGVTGVKMFGDATATANFASKQSIGGDVSVGIPLTLDFLVASGTTNGGTLFGVVPIHYAFQISDSDAASFDITWQLTLSANGSPVFTFTSGAVQGNNALISGNLATNNLPPVTVNSYAIDFKVIDSNASNGQSLTVHIPSSSVDINSLTSVPEPGTFALLGSALIGIGGLAWRRRRTKS